MRKALPFLFLLVPMHGAFSQTSPFSNNSPNDPVKLNENMTKADFVPGVILIKFKGARTMVLDICAVKVHAP